VSSDRLGNETPTNSNNAPVAIAIELVSSANYAMQQNDVPLIRAVRVENLSGAALAEIRVRISASREVFAPIEMRLDALAAGSSHRFSPVDVVLAPDVLCNQLERERLSVVTEVFAKEDLLAKEAAPFDLLAFNEWQGSGGLAELVAAFITPNHPSVESLVAETRDVLGRTTGNPSLSGYQSQSSERVRQTALAAAAAFAARSIGYVNPPASFEQTGQKVRSVDQVLDGRLGTCLDLVTALAAVLEQIGLHTLIVLLKTHAMLGVWLRDSRFPQTLVDDRAILAKRVRLGEILLLETTALVAGSAATPTAAEELAIRRIEGTDEFAYAVDVAACRRERIRPLPSRLSSASGFQVVADSPTTPPAPPPLERDLTPAQPKPSSRRATKSPPAKAQDLSDEASERLDRWKRKLLDLSLRNRLLNYKDTKRSVPLLVPDLPSLEDLLEGGKRFDIGAKSETLKGLRDSTAESRRTGMDAETGTLTQLMHDGRLASPLPPAELGHRLLQIYRDARTSIEESGSNTLYLAMGTLRWFESNSSDVSHVAPLVLLPVTLKRSVSGREFSLERSDEDVRVNVTLLEKLFVDFGIDGSHLETLEQDDSGHDIRAALKGFVALVKDEPRWEVRDDAILSLFSFAKFVMWADLETRSEQIATSKVVRRLLDRSSPTSLADIEHQEEPDRPSPNGGPMPALDADSSQLAAVHAAIRGRTFVLQGPPGTGKSQTITNILASAIASGKRVLFVAEKMAALGVVKRRLQRLGLGPYCLELHSSKSGKKEVMAQLQEAMDAPRAIEPAEWPERVREVEKSRNELNDYIRAIHQIRLSGESVYSVIGRHSRTSTSPRISLSFAEPYRVTKERLEFLRTSVATLVHAANGAGDLASHPLRGIATRVWEPDLAARLREAASSLERCTEHLRITCDAALATLGMAGNEAALQMSHAELDWLSQAIRRLLEHSSPTDGLLRESDWESLKQSLVSDIARGKQRDEDWSRLQSRYRETVLTANLDDLDAKLRHAQSLGWPLNWLRTRTVRNELRSHAVNAREVGDAIASDIQLAKAIVAATAHLNSPSSVGRRLLGSRWGNPDYWEKAMNLVAWATDIRALIASKPSPKGLSDQFVDVYLRLASSDSHKLSPGSSTRRSLDSLLQAFEHFRTACAAVHRAASFASSELAGPDDSGYLPCISAAAVGWQLARDLLPDWCAWRDAAALDDAAELLPLARALGSGAVSPSDARRSFEHAFADAWLADCFRNDEILRRFSLSRHDQTLARFRASDSAIVQLGASVVRARRQQLAPPPALVQANPESELGLLKRQMLLQRRHMPVRKLIEKLPNVLPRLKPCWLMSPMSVAQYLDPKLPPFDLVVFDEASQIPVWDAIGAIARGAEAIVVGDSRQLPPTNFFAKQEAGDIDDDTDFDELESVLDEAKAASFPELALMWHYRSRHESLIAFSNHHYYSNQLLTFPSPETDVAGLGVSLVHLPHGAYDKAGSRTNRVEAEAIVAEVIRRLKIAGDGPVSLGIVTFSVAQQYLVEDLMDAERLKHPDLERFFAADADEPVFIKNLENVQGDERDVILFSICYGPHRDGQMSMNFGPINRQGGERRLNVAITRARREVVVFTSIRPEQIDLSRTRAVGAAHLRTFLDYAKRGPRAILEAAKPGEATESPFEEAVRLALISRGHLVDVQVGCSGYRIDLAIKDPSNPGRYVLGIECDGAAYHSTKAARDRDRLREQVLRGLGWRIHRVWSTDWFQSQSSCLARIEKAIQEAASLAASTRPELAPSSPGMAPLSSEPDRIASQVESSTAIATEPATLRGAKPYECAILPTTSRDPERLRDGSAVQQISKDISTIVSAESPVHVDRVTSILADAWGVGRMSSRAQQAIDAALSRVVKGNRVRMDGEFLIALSPAVTAQPSFRVPSPDGQNVRPIEHIHPSEMSAAIGAILERQFSMPLSSLCTELARVFGMQRATGKCETAVRKSLEVLSKGGQCRLDGESVSL
jgi:very-short-patch-repair endonuclease